MRSKMNWKDKPLKLVKDAEKSYYYVEDHKGKTIGMFAWHFKHHRYEYKNLR